MVIDIVPLIKFYAEQMPLLLRTKCRQLHNHADTKSVKCSKRQKCYATYIQYIHTHSIKSGLLETPEKVALRNCAVVHLGGNTGYMRWWAFLLRLQFGATMKIRKSAVRAVQVKCECCAT